MHLMCSTTTPALTIVRIIRQLLPVACRVDQLLTENTAPDLSAGRFCRRNSIGVWFPKARVKETLAGSVDGGRGLEAETTPRRTEGPALGIDTHTARDTQRCNMIAFGD